MNITSANDNVSYSHIELSGGASGNVFKNLCISSNISGDINLTGASINNTFLNCTYNQSKEYVSGASELKRAWYFTGQVNYSYNGTAVDSATVIPYNSTEDSQTTQTTNNVGRIPLLGLVYYTNINGVTTYQQNYSINVSKVFWDTISKSFNMSTNFYNATFNLTDHIQPSIYINTSFINGSYLNYNNSIEINVTVFDVNLESCWYSDNWTTNLTFTCGENLSLNLSQGLHTLVTYTNDTIGNSNYTFITITTDVVYPFINISTINITTGSQNIAFDTNISDINLNASKCKFSIFNSTGGIDGFNNNISFTCNSWGAATVTEHGTYNLTIYAKDYAYNENLSIKTFTTSAGGGGGGDARDVR
jgi:hypothetical protein